MWVKRVLRPVLRSPFPSRENFRGFLLSLPLTRLLTPVDATDAPLSAVVQGLWCTSDASGVISITGGEYQIEGGVWGSANGTIALGDKVRVRMTTSSSPFTLTTLTLTVDGVAYTFTVTTLDASRVTVGGQYVLINGEYITIGS